MDTLQELVELVAEDPGVVVALDIKNDNMGVEAEATIDAVLETIEAYGVEEQFMLMLYKQASVEYARKAAPWVCHKRHTMGGMSQEEVLANLKEMGATCLCINGAILDGEFLTGLEKLGIVVIPYALGIDRSWEEILELIHLYAKHKVYGMLSEHLSESIAHRDKCMPEELQEAQAGIEEKPARELPTDWLEP